MPAVAGTHAPGRGEGVEGFRGWLRHTITYLSSSCCGRKGEKQCQVVGKLTPHMLWKGRRTGQSIRVEYSEPLAAWNFPRQGTPGSYAVDGCARTRFVYFSKTSRGRCKKQIHDNKRTNNAIFQAGCTTTSTERRAHRTAHFTQLPGHPQPAYISAPSVGCGLLTALWLATPMYVKKM